MSELATQFELEQLDQMSAPLRDVCERLDDLNGLLEQVHQTLDSATASLSTYESFTSSATQSTSALNVAQQELASTNQNVSSTVDTTADHLGYLTSILVSTTTAASGGSTALQAVANNAKGATEALTSLTEKAALLTTALLKATEAANGLKDSFSHISNISPAGTVHQFNGSLIEMNSTAQQSLGTLGRLRDAMNNVTKSDTFKENWTTGQNNWAKAQSRAAKVPAYLGTLTSPIERSADFEDNLTQIALNLNKHGPDLTNFVDQERIFVNQLARQTSQPGTALTGSERSLSAAGFQSDQIHHVLPTIATIAQASKIDSNSLAGVAALLRGKLGISDPNAISKALSSLAVVSRQNHIPTSDLIAVLPRLASEAVNSGLKGRGAFDDILATFSMARQSTASVPQAAFSTQQFLKGINSPAFAEAMKKQGVDVSTLQSTARAQHQDPILAVLDAIRKVSVQAHGDFRPDILNSLFPNKETQLLVKDLLSKSHDFQNIRAASQKDNRSALNADFQATQNDPKTELQKFHEALDQLMRRIGKDLTPILHDITSGLNAVNVALEWMDKTMPGVSGVVIEGIGVFMGLVAAIYAVGAVIAAVSSGLAFLSAAMEVVGAVIAAIGWPVTLVIAGIAALGVAVYELCKHWGTVKAWLISVGHTVGRAIQKIGAPLGLILGPIGAVGVALYELWKHWDTAKAWLDKAGIATVEFINKLCNGIPDAFHRIVESIKGVFTHLPGFLSQLGEAFQYHIPKANPALLGSDGRYKPLVSPEEQWKRDWAAHPMPMARRTPPPLPPQRHESHIRLDVHNDQGLKTKARHISGPPLQVHHHGGPNSMMGRP